MNKKLLLGTLTASLISLTPVSQAADLRIVWDNGGGDFEFTNPLNWANVADASANHTLPGNFVDAGDTTNAIIQNGDTVSLTSNFTAANQFDILIVRFNSGLDISADLNTNNTPILHGQIAGSTDVINQTAGTVTASSLTIGTGDATYNLSGGALNLSGLLSLNNGDGSTFSLQGDSATASVGALTLTGAATLDFEFGATGVNAIDVNSGFTIDANALLTIDGSAYTGGPATIDLVTFGSVTGAFADPANINITGFSGATSIGYDSDSMFLTIVPEPGSLALLGLGGLLVAHRRRK